jgi:hypothetical protein
VIEGGRFYLAARYSRREELCRYRTQLDHIFKAIGWRVQSRWLAGEHQWDGAAVEAARAYESGKEHPDAVRFALDDWEDVQGSDIVIVFTEPPRAENSSRGGRHVELGLALAWGKKVLVVGHKENVFCLLPQVEFCPTWSDVVVSLTMALAGPVEAA